MTPLQVSDLNKRRNADYLNKDVRVIIDNISNFSFQ